MIILVSSYVVVQGIGRAYLATGGAVDIYGIIPYLTYLADETHVHTVCRSAHTDTRHVHSLANRIEIESTAIKSYLRRLFRQIEIEITSVGLTMRYPSLS